MKFLIKTIIVTLISIFLLKSITHTPETVKNTEPEKTEKILKSDIIKEEDPVVKITVKSNSIKEKSTSVTKKLGSKTLEKTHINGKTAVILSQKVHLKFDENLNESYTIDTKVIYWTKVAGSSYVYSNYLYDIKPKFIEDIKLKEYNLAVLAKDKILKIQKNK